MESDCRLVDLCKSTLFFPRRFRQWPTFTFILYCGAENWKLKEINHGTFSDLGLILCIQRLISPSKVVNKGSAT